MSCKSELVKGGILACKTWPFAMQKTIFRSAKDRLLLFVRGCRCLVPPWLLFRIAYRVYPVGYVFEDFGRDGFFYLSVFDGEAGGACLEQVVEAGVGLYGV